jgi:hypothetical protein
MNLPLAYFFCNIHQHSWWPHVRLIALDILGWFPKNQLLQLNQYNCCVQLSLNKDLNFWLIWVHCNSIIWPDTYFGIVQLFLPRGIHAVISSIIKIQSTSDAFCSYLLQGSCQVNLTLCVFLRYKNLWYFGFSLFLTVFCEHYLK